MHYGKGMVKRKAIFIGVLIAASASVAPTGYHVTTFTLADQLVPKSLAFTAFDKLFVSQSKVWRSSHGFNTMGTRTCIDGFIVSEILGQRLF